MTDQTLDPRDDRLDDDEPVVNLDTADDEVAAEDETADDKYVQVIDGRPETLGSKDDMWKSEPGSEGRDREGIDEERVVNLDDDGR